MDALAAALEASMQGGDDLTDHEEAVRDATGCQVRFVIQVFVSVFLKANYMQDMKLIRQALRDQGGSIDDAIADVLQMMALVTGAPLERRHRKKL